MDAKYGCDVSNRYMDYLDSSDHGNSMSSSVAKNKRRTKKKRKPKNPKLIDDCTNSESNVPTQSAQTTTNIGGDDVADKKQSFSSGHKSATDDDSAAINHEIIKTNASDCPASVVNCDSPLQSQASSQIDFVVNDNGDDTAKEEPQKIKWSEMCLEEEEKLMKMDAEQANQEVPVVKLAVVEPELASKRRIYPTIYIYNSNFGNKNCRSTDWHDLNRRFNSTADDDCDTNRTTEGNKKSRGNLHFGRGRNNYTAKRYDDDNEQGGLSEKGDEKYTTDSRNISNERRASQQNNEPNQREYINSKHRHDEFTNGMPERNFVRRRRRQDFVRNV